MNAVKNTMKEESDDDSSDEDDEPSDGEDMDIEEDDSENGQVVDDSEDDDSDEELAAKFLSKAKNTQKKLATKPEAKKNKVSPMKAIAEKVDVSDMDDDDSGDDEEELNLQQLFKAKKGAKKTTTPK